MTSARREQLRRMYRIVALIAFLGAVCYAALDVVLPSGLALLGAPCVLLGAVAARGEL